MENFNSLINFFKDYKDSFEGLYHLVLAVGVCIGGYWTYICFVRNRTGYPHVEFTHTNRFIKLNSEKYLLNLQLNVKNSGNVIVCLNKIETDISQVKPLPASFDILKQQVTPSCELEWMTLGSCIKKIDYSPERCEIEPGEFQVFNFEFIIDSYIKVIKVYSYIPNLTKDNLGWDISSIVTIKNHLEGDEND